MEYIATTAEAATGRRGADYWSDGIDERQEE